MNIPRVNEIMKQMRSQRTMFAYSSRNNNNNKLLPVENHVKNTLLESFAHKLLSIVNDNISSPSSSPSQKKVTLPKSNNKNHHKTIKDVISIIKKTWQLVLSSSEDTELNIPMCIRLREEPLIALRRASRLYICAGNGPGNMRSNAWISVNECS